MNESLLSHKINNHISYVTTLKEGIYINYRENQDKNYKTRLCLCLFYEYGVVFDVQVLSRLCSFCLLSVCFHRSAVKQKTQAYLAQLI